MNPEIIERIAHFADIDSRRALGFLPRKLPPNDLLIKQGSKWWHMGRPYTEVSFIQNVVSLEANEDGQIIWHFGLRRYTYSRPP
jgi:hypothetical protein